MNMLAGGIWILVITELAVSGTRLTKKRFMVTETCRRQRKHQSQAITHHKDIKPATRVLTESLLAFGADAPSWCPSVPDVTRQTLLRYNYWDFALVMFLFD